MTTTLSRARALAARTLMIAGMYGAIHAPAQTIPNPSFEGQAFTVFPGYISLNTAINGWTASRNDRAGLNPSAGSPFADNGVIPNGTNVAFLQSAQGGAPSVLGTTITGLTAGQKYQVNFRMNVRTGAGAAGAPVINVGVDNAPIVSFNLTNVGGANPYRFGAFDFVATGATAALTFTNNTAADATLLLDDFSIAATNLSWTVAPFTDDANIDIDSSRVYTHAYNFGGASAPNVTINGVNFTGVVGGNPSVPGSFRVEGVGSTFNSDDANLVTGSSATLMKRFIYNGNPGKLFISGLTPGVEYVATIYTIGWETGFRCQTLAHGNNRVTFNEDAFGDGSGVRISYRYIAPANGTAVIEMSPLWPAFSLHIFGFSNYQVTSPGLPIFTMQPRNQITQPGSNVGFQVLAAGATPITYQWLTNGVEMTGETNRFLSRANVSASDLVSYQAVASNAFGAVTSSVATISFGQIANPSFESQIFTGYPGYASGNTNISGWTLSTPTRSGQNPLLDSGGPFANNGTIPDGNQVAFLQSTSSISTVIDGLVPNTRYAVRYRVNARGGQTPVLHSAIDGQLVLDTRLNNVTGTNAYRLVSLEFVASNTTAVLSLTNDQAGDTTALIDNFSILANTSKWSIAAWTNDASAGVDSTKLYTHAFHFGSTVPDTTINGVTFKGISGANPAVAGQFTMSGFPSVYTGVDSNVFNMSGGGSAGMSQQFIYGGARQSITLSNLYPGVAYVFTLYSIGWDARPYGRAATFNFNGDLVTLNQDAFDLDNGIRFSYPYVADASGTATFVFEATDTGSTIHTYAFANYAAVDTAPIIAVQPRDAFVAVGDTTTLSVALSAGTQPTFYQWQLGESDLLEQTNATLVLSNLTAGAISNYRVIISNSLGAVTSRVASVEWGVKLSEVYSTGVDNTGAVIGDGAIDPHYRLIYSADPASPGPDAFALIDGVYPVQPGTYVANSLTSRWIAPTTNVSSVLGNVGGTYVYRTSFIIDSTDPAHSQISGAWASDNDGVDILLNGVSLGISNHAARPFGELFPFVITNGFVAGSNTLDFVITNFSAGPTAFRAELRSVGRPLAATPPGIVTQPSVPAVLQEGQDVTLAVVARGSGPLTYRWYAGEIEWEIDIPGETNRTLHFSNIAQFDQDGAMYWVRVMNAEGFSNSIPVLFTVNAQPIANDDAIACASNQPVTFAASKLLVNDSDPESDALSVFAVSTNTPNGGTVSLVAGQITYTPSPTFSGTDTFTYTLADARGGRDVGTVSVNVGATNFLSVVIAPAVLPNGHFQVGYSGVPGYSYTIERATNILGPWQVFTNIVADGNGAFTVEDPNPPAEPMRFYRTRYP